MAVTRRNSTATAAALMPQVLETMERLRPPHQLVDEQVEVWRLIVDGHPADWFDAGSVPVLAQLCRHVVIANRLAEMIERAEVADVMLELLKEQRSESNEIRKLSTTLRITPLSLINKRGNKNPIAAAFRTPWNRHTDPV